MIKVDWELEKLKDECAAEVFSQADAAAKDKAAFGIPQIREIVGKAMEQAIRREIHGKEA